MSAPPFQLFGPAHIAAMVLMVAVAAAMTIVARRSESPRVTRGLCIGLAAVLLVNQTVGWVYRYATEGGEVFVREHLPLHVCGMTILLSAAMLLFHRRWTFEIVYFWGLAGATNAMVTPELSEAFPHYLFFQYFISHGAIVVAALFATFGLGMRPTFRSLVRAFVALNVMAVAVTPVNLARGRQLHVLAGDPGHRVSLHLPALALVSAEAGSAGRSLLWTAVSAGVPGEAMARAAEARAWGGAHCRIGQY